MRTLYSRGLLIAVAALSLALGEGLRGDAAAAQSEPSGAAAWLDSAVLEKHCPLQPVNVPAALLQTSDAALRRRVSIVGDALRIGGTAGPDHIIVRTGGPPISSASGSTADFWGASAPSPGSWLGGRRQ